MMFLSYLRFIETASDGHMRLMCCGNAVTGIGNVPKWDPPKRKQKFKMLKNGDLQVIVNDPNEKKDDEKNEKEELASDEEVDASAPEKYLDE